MLRCEDLLSKFHNRIVPRMTKNDGVELTHYQPTATPSTDKPSATLLAAANDALPLEVDSFQFFKCSVKHLGLYTKTFVLFYSWVCLGLYSEMLGPLMETLKYLTQSNYEQISFALAVRAAGLFSGSLVGGFLHDRFRRFRSPFLCVALISAGLTVIILPYCQSLVPLSLLLFWAGCTHGFHTTGGNPSLAELWQDKASGPFNFMHAGYGVGAALAPILLKPFSERITPNNHFNLTTTTTVTSSLLSNNQTVAEKDVYLVSMPIPCGIIATLCFVCGLCFLSFPFLPTLNFLGRVEAASATSNRLKVGFLTTLRRQFTNRFYCVFILMVFVLYFFLVGNERVFGKFVFSYTQHGPLQFSNDESYLILTMYWVFFSVARFTSLVVAFFLPPQLFFILLLSGTFLSAAVLNCFPYSAGVFFVFATSFGFFKSPLFPTGLGVINRYIEVSGIVTLFINLGSSCGAMALQYFLGYLLDHYGQFNFLYLLVSSAVVLLLAGIAIVLTGTAKGERFDKSLQNERCQWVGQMRVPFLVRWFHAAPEEEVDNKVAREEKPFSIALENGKTASVSETVKV